MIYKILLSIINFLLRITDIWIIKLLRLNNYLVKKRFRKHLSQEKYQQYLKEMEKK